MGRRSLREHRTAAKAWDAARAQATSRRSGDKAWQAWAKKDAASARRQLKAQQARKRKG